MPRASSRQACASACAAGEASAGSGVRRYPKRDMEIAWKPWAASSVAMSSAWSTAAGPVHQQHCRPAPRRRELDRPAARGGDLAAAADAMALTAQVALIGQPGGDQGAENSEPEDRDKRAARRDSHDVTHRP